jgi:MFS family permease
MTTQAVTSQTQAIGRDQAASAAERRPQLLNLLSIPGFLQLCVSNGLAHSFGQRMQGIAVAWVVLEMTGSKFWLGVINGVPTISIVLFSLIGGVIADSREARRVLLATRVALAVTAVLAALLVSSGQVQLSHLLVYVLLIVGIAAIDMPVSRTLMHEVVGSARLLGAGAAQSVFMNMVNIAAPLGIGVLIGVAGSSAAFWVLGAGYSVAALLVLNGGPSSQAREARGSNPFEDVAAGLSYIRRTPAVAALVGLGFLVPVAGVYFAMVPVIARETLNTGPGGLGVLVASFSVGSLLGSVYLAVNGAMRRRGLSLTLLGVVFGCGMMGFALSNSIELSCAISFVMGVSAGFWQNMLSAMVQLVAAPEMRGRVVSVFTMAFQLMGIGWLAAGTLASAFGNEVTLLVAGATFSVLSIGVFAVSKETRDID